MAYSPSKYYFLAPILLGIATFLCFFGWQPLNPLQLLWLNTHTDPIQAWLGWTFFRESPWTWPPGLNPAYGLELGNSIIYTDSIPLLAILFKPLTGCLPPLSQYFGWWLCLCLILQAFFSWKLLRLFLPGLWAPLMGCCLFLFAPIVIYRIHLHITLVGQFLILSALFLCLNRYPTSRHWPAWLALLAITALIHAYFVFMIGLLWGADIFNRFIRHELPAAKAAMIGISGIVLTLLSCWLAGYFAISPGGAGGFGLYKMNLLAIFDPDSLSFIMPDLPNHAGEEEGYNFLGIGTLLLFLLALYNILTGHLSLRPILMRYWPLLVACLIFLLIALTNVIGIGPYTLTLPRPQSWERWLQPIFRASGRFFWPINYLILLTAIYCLFKSYRFRTALVILTIAAIAQIADTSREWLFREQPRRDFLANSPMRSLFWSDLPYKKLRILPFENVRGDWQALGIFAALNGMQTDAVYVSRTDDKRVHELNRRNEEMVARREFDPDTLYILDQKTYKQLKDQLPNSLIDLIDGYYVLAPGYFAKDQLSDMPEKRPSGSNPTRH